MVEGREVLAVLYPVWPVPDNGPDRLASAAERDGLPDCRQRILTEPSSMPNQRLASAPELEVKTSDPTVTLVSLLNDMTMEMRAQFDGFRQLRDAADRVLARPAEDSEAKTARSDLKAASDAMSVIIRSLEKIDQLQRQLAQERRMASEREGGDEDHETLVAKLEQLIETRVAERLAQAAPTAEKPIKPKRNGTSNA